MSCRIVDVHLDEFAARDRVGNQMLGQICPADACLGRLDALFLIDKPH